MRKILIYTLSLLGGSFFGFGLGWLFLSLVTIISIASNAEVLSDWSGGLIGYPLLLFLPVGSLTGAYMSFQYAKKNFESTSHKNLQDRRVKLKALVFIAAGSAGLLLMFYKVATQYS